MNRSILLCFSVLMLVSCSKDENPYRMELSGLLKENEELKQAVVDAEMRRDGALAFASLLQSQNERISADLTRQNENVAKLSADNDDLRVQLGVITERERAANEKMRSIAQANENTQRQQDLNRLQQLAAIAAANKEVGADVPFRVFDVMFVGKKTTSPIRRNFGRFSVRNYTDKPLRTTARSGSDFVEFVVPSNSSTNGVFIQAERGDKVYVKSGSYEETYTW